MKEIKFLVPYVVFTAFSYYFAKNGLIYASPFAFMGLRYLLAAGVLLAMSRKLIFSRNLLYLSLMTITSTMFWSYGLLYVSPAESAVLSYSMPLFSLPIAFFMVSEKPSRTELIGIFVGFTGIMVYGLPLLQGFTEIGMILTVINAFFWGMFTVFYRKLKDQDPVSINASQMLIGGLIMMALSPLDFSLRINYEFLIDLLWMGTMGGALQFLLWNYMIRISKVNRITVLAFSVPIFTMVLGAIMSDAFPGILTTAGVSIMFFGILISRLKGGISIVDNGAH
ncbi:MAG: DMT family transporter [Candidatus Thermoplasmatota archaeon]|nr:DMT family transporter [Candidatus Thermoplasmatota archaeon]